MGGPSGGKPVQRSPRTPLAGAMGLRLHEAVPTSTESQLPVFHEVWVWPGYASLATFRRTGLRAVPSEKRSGEDA
jgi:hypothetical protein